MATVWPLTKTVKIGDTTVKVVCNKTIFTDGRAEISATAELNGRSYSSKWTLPHDNPNYSVEQAQKDFDAHCQQTASNAVGRLQSQSHLDALQ